MRENNIRADNRLVWIEPKIEELNVSETANHTGPGTDGGGSSASLAS